MNNKRIFTFYSILVGGGIFFLNCATHNVYQEDWIHEPPLAKNVLRIIEGQTTRDEILKWFGPPDLSAEGAEISLYPESLAGLKRAKQKAECEEHRRLLEELDVEEIRGYRCDYIDELAKLQPYSSIDENHLAYLYTEYSISCGPSGTDDIIEENMQRSNRLLIFIDKNTNVVDDFCFREDFTVE